MRVLVQRLETDPAQAMTRVYRDFSAWAPPQAADHAGPDRWMLIESDQIESAATRELLAGLAPWGLVTIAARFPHHGPPAARAVSAALGTLKELGARVQLFYYSDQQFDLLTSFFFGSADYRTGDAKRSVPWESPSDADPLIGPAHARVRDRGEVALSLIQRILKIGYRSAAALAQALS